MSTTDEECFEHLMQRLEDYGGETLTIVMMDGDETLGAMVAVSPEALDEVVAFLRARDAGASN